MSKTMINKLRRFDKSKLVNKFNEVNWQLKGCITDVIGTLVLAHLKGVKHGSLVRIQLPDQRLINAEVVGFKAEKAMLLPYDRLQGLQPGAEVEVLDEKNLIPAGHQLLGSIIDPFGYCLGSGFNFSKVCPQQVEIERSAPNPIQRQRIRNPLCLGVKAIDGMLTFGEGQRIGIMAGSGVGKSVLLGMIANGSQAEINIIALIGERGREVREFIERELGPEGLKKSVVVVVTSDQSPLMRIRGAKAALSLAEFFAEQGKKVLFMMDSLTRIATAQREIGLAIGEPPTTKGYPPSVFTLLPRLLERCGPLETGHGSISGLFTVLVDGDDFNDPLPDTVRGILDGHINLSRQLAARGHYPAIDIPTSASRAMYDIVEKEHWDKSLMIRNLIATYEENYDLIQLGAYHTGTNPTLDLALKLMPHIFEFLTQDRERLSSYEDALIELAKIVAHCEFEDKKG